VVQIWPGLVRLVYTQISPGHIWTTLYIAASTSAYTSRCWVTDLNHGYAFTLSSLKYRLQILHIKSSLHSFPYRTELSSELNNARTTHRTQHCTVAWRKRLYCRVGVSLSNGCFCGSAVLARSKYATILLMIGNCQGVPSKIHEA
jgi:hypothetical protein